MPQNNEWFCDQLHLLRGSAFCRAITVTALLCMVLVAHGAASAVAIAGEALAPATAYASEGAAEGAANPASPQTLVAADTSAITPGAPANEAKQDMYRLYNMNSGEHFYTSSTTERDQLIELGWFYEGTGWVAPQKSNVPVYRLYNRYAGDHHYTTSATERDQLVRLGWRSEGIGWYSDEQKRVAICRVYNPNGRTGAHHFTSSTAERDQLVRIGWRNEQVGWYAIEGGTGASSPLNYNHLQIIVNNVSGSGGLVTQYGTITQQARARVDQVRNQGTAMSFVAINVRTGKCIASSADRRIFSASTIKVADVAALCKFKAPDLIGQRSTMYDVITYSSDDGYNSLFYRYGSGYLERFAAESGVKLDLKYSTLYADITPRELAKLWLNIRRYIISDDANVGLFKGLFGNGAYYKEGWMYSNEWSGQMYHLAGVDDAIVYAIMTRDSRPNANVWALKDALYAALS